MIHERPKDWAKWLPLAEWWYNTTFHNLINTTSYAVVYGQPAPVHMSYLSGDSNVASYAVVSSFILPEPTIA